MAAPDRSHLRAVPAGASTKTLVDPYGFDPRYERDLVTSVCSRPAAYSRVGALIDAKLLGSPACTLAVQAAQAVAHDSGKGPSSCSLVVQRLARWRDEGRIPQERIEEVLALFDAAMDAGLPDVDGLVAEAAAVLKRRAQQKVVEQSMAAYAKRGSMADVAKAAAAVDSIGVSGMEDGALLNVDSFAGIDSLRLMERLPTGCPEFDNVLGGGFPRGMTMFLGREKAGKSLVLSSIAAQGFYNGLHVAVATLELGEELQQARVIANLTGVPIDEILAGKMDVAKERLLAMAPKFGVMAIRYFAPSVTQVSHLHEWLDQREQKVGRKVDLFVLDYVTKLNGGGDRKRYEELEQVGDLLRERAMERRSYVISAGQARRPQAGKKKKLDTDDTADSMHLVRSPDLVIAMRMSEDDTDSDDAKGQVDYFVAAGRLSKDRIGTGPLPVDRACGRMFPIAREEGW